MATRDSRTTVSPVGVPGNERISAFSDAVFAIAITLLVLDLRVPDQLPDTGLAGVLPEMVPSLAAFVLSFVVVGVYWVGQHNMLMHVQRHNRILLWLNLLFLLFVAATPFFAGLIMHHLEDRLAVAAYASNLVAAGLALDAVWWYASTKRRLVDPALDRDLVAFIHRRVLIAPALYLGAAGLSFVSQLSALAIIVAVPLLYIFPTPLDHYHHRQLTARSDQDAVLNDES